MKHTQFHLPSDDLYKCLQRQFGGLDSKDYEYVVAYHICKYFEKKDSISYQIGFVLNKAQQGVEISPEVGQKLSLEEKCTILRNNLEENTEVDFTLIPFTYGKSLGYSYPFQIKQYRSSNNSMSELAKYIAKKANRYSAPLTSLVIAPIGEGSFTNKHIEELKQLCTINPTSFRNAYLFGFYESGEPITSTNLGITNSIKRRRIFRKEII